MFYVDFSQTFGQELIFRYIFIWFIDVLGRGDIRLKGGRRNSFLFGRFFEKSIDEVERGFFAFPGNRFILFLRRIFQFSQAIISLTGGVAMTVVYLDSVFLFNALIDYLLVLAAARLAGIPLHRGRYAFCGLLGGLYAAAVFLPGCGFLAAVPVKMAAGVLLALGSFGGERHFLRLTMLTFAIACALAGTVLGLGLLAGQSIPHARGVFYTNVNGKTLLISASGLYVLLAVLFRAAAAHGIRGERIPIRVSLMGRTVALMALRDTGHRLRDISGNPVLTVELRCFPQLAAEVSQLPAVEALPLLRRKYPELRPQLLPIHTAACCSA